MAKTIGKVIKAGKKIFDHLDSKVNFTIPENLVSYLGINGRQNDKNLELTESNFRLQIGKMQKDKETIYTKELLLPAIEYIIKKTGENEKVVIQLRPDLAKFLANEDQKEESKHILSFEEEKQKITQLIKKYFKNKTENIKIISVSNQYPEIFSVLKEKGKDGLSSTEKPILNKDNFSALNISKYLYRLSQKNPKLMELFYSTKTPVQKENDTKPIGENQSDYYSLVEVSIRLYEVLSGISIQGGIDRQIKYDKIIGGILQRKDIDPFKIKNYPELEELHNVCLETNPDFIFDRLRIGTKDAEKVGKEFQEKTQQLSKLKSISLITSVALMSVLAGLFGGYAISDYNQKKKAKKNVAEKIEQHDINIKFEGSQAWKMSSLEDKTHYLSSISNAFASAYGLGDITKENIFYMIVDAFDDNSFTYQSQGKYKFQKLNFINQKIIPTYKVQFQNNGIDLEPCMNFSGYEDAFINSYLDTTNINIKETALDLQFTGSNIDPQEIHKIGEYTSIQGSTYEIGYVLRDFKIQNGNVDSYGGLYGLNGSTVKSKRYLVAKYKTDPSSGFQDKFSIENGKTLCEDYFLRTRPQIQFAYNIITMICRDMEKTYISESQYEDILDVLTEYFVKKRIPRDTISKFQEGIYPKDRMDLVYKKILPNNAEKFRKIGIDPSPYNVFNNFIDAFQNSENYHNTSKYDLDEDISIPTYKDLAKYNYKYIGNYISQNGQSYAVYYITVQDKRYIIASEINGHYQDNDLCISYGKDVREDFQKNRLNNAK